MAIHAIFSSYHALDYFHFYNGVRVAKTRVSDEVTLPENLATLVTLVTLKCYTVFTKRQNPEPHLWPADLDAEGGTDHAGSGVYVTN